MFRFFRVIRQRLLSRNKVKTYLAYALGEIILVVIGIIVALQLNNWNEARRELNTELQLHMSLLEDLTNEYSSIEYHKKRVIGYDKLHLHLYNESIGKASYSPNEFYNYLLWFHRYNTFIKEKYAESLNTITNVNIHQELKSYMRQESYTKAAVEEWNQHQLQHVRPFLSRHGINNSSAMFNNNINEFAPIINTVELVDHSRLNDQFGSEELDQLLFTIRFKTLWMIQNFNWLQEQNREFQLVLSHEMNTSSLEGTFTPVDPISIQEFTLIGMSTEEIIEIITQEVKKPNYNFTESEVNKFGYDQLKEEKLNDALTVFKLNTELYPDQYNTYDSYGECLLKIGDIDNAIKAYERSLELNPESTTAIEALNSITKGS